MTVIYRVTAIYRAVIHRFDCIHIHFVTFTDVCVETGSLSRRVQTPVKFRDFSELFLCYFERY